MTPTRKTYYKTAILLLLLFLLTGCLSSNQSPSSERNIYDMSDEELENVAESVQHKIVDHHQFPIGTAATKMVVGRRDTPRDALSKATIIDTDEFLTKGTLYVGYPNFHLEPDSMDWIIYDESIERHPSVNYTVESYNINQKLIFKRNNETHKIDNVTPEEGSLYEVNIDNRTQWKYESFHDEAQEVVLSDIKSVKGDRRLYINLDPEKEEVVDYIRSQYASLTGVRNWDIPKSKIRLSRSNVAHVDARVAASIHINSTGEIELNEIVGLYVEAVFISSENPVQVEFESMYMPAGDANPGQTSIDIGP